MANALYDGGREGFLDGSIDWDTDTIKVVAVGSGYAVNLGTHRNLSDVTSGARIATSAALTGKTVTAGVADASDVTLTAVASGSTITRLVIYKDTGTESTSRLVASIDTVTGGSLSVPTNGGDITIAWDNGTNKIFTL